MIRALRASDTTAVLGLLRRRPVHNVFLEYVVRSGALGRAAGLFGWWDGPAPGAVCMIGPGGSTALEVSDPAAFGELAAFAARTRTRPRHVVGPDDVTTPFVEAYRPLAPPLRWARYERVFEIDAASLRPADPLPLERARSADVAAVTENSAAQHLEDLADDRRALDPGGFFERHRTDVREGRWWIARDAGEIAFQVHVGPANAEVVQIGGVFTQPDRRGRGWATRGVRAVVEQLLERAPGVTLFCHEENRTASRVYERVGFRPSFRYRSFLFETRLDTGGAPPVGSAHA